AMVNRGLSVSGFHLAVPKDSLLTAASAGGASRRPPTPAADAPSAAAPAPARPAARRKDRRPGPTSPCLSLSLHMRRTVRRTGEPSRNAACQPIAHLAELQANGHRGQWERGRLYLPGGRPPV